MRADERATRDANAGEPRLDVLVVCDDDDTLIRLREYLTRAGVRARATRRLAEAWRLYPECQAVVLLPDDFDAGEVTDGLDRLLSSSPGTFVIVVTAGPQQFEPLIRSSGNPGAAVLMPKPVWGWTILDLLRNRLGNPVV